MGKYDYTTDETLAERQAAARLRHYRQMQKVARINAAAGSAKANRAAGGAKQ